MAELTVLEQLVKDDFGLIFQGRNYARAVEHDSLIINREKQIFYWNSEGIVGDSYVYLTKVRHYSPEDAKNYLKQFKFTGTFIHEIKNGEESVVYPKLIDIFHDNLLKGDKSYFYNRGITDETMSRYKLGLFDNYYMIPIYQDGIFKQFQMRRDSPKLIRVYYKGMGDLLFNSDILKITNKIYITESLISAILLGQNGVPAVSMTCGCEGFMPEWIKYFVHQREIIILFDRDSAGDNGAIRTAKILGESRCKIYNFFEYDFAKGYAVDDFLLDGNTVKDLMLLVQTESKYPFELVRESKFKNRTSQRKFGT